MENLDHIVYVCRNLDESVKKFRSKLGINIYPGGRHLTKGTHNALFRIGAKAYFELLAPDPDRDPDINLEWLGTGNTKIERISHWCVRPNNLTKALTFMNQTSKYNYSIHPGQRKKSNGQLLEWELGLSDKIMDTDVFPFLIDWHQSVHPSEEMENNCEIEELIIQHSCPEKIQGICNEYDINASFEKSASAHIKLKLKTPIGSVLIE